MPLFGLEPKIPLFVWAKKVHALDHAATVIGKILIIIQNDKCPTGKWRNK
jgi:hypothetical protein